MSLFDINGWEFIIILVVAAFVIGPERLPKYIAQLRGWIRQGRTMAESARGQLREQMGPDFDDIDWSQYDPRQYDPRRIVREALSEPMDSDAPEKDTSPDAAAGAGAVKPVSRRTTYDPTVPTPWDGDAT